jgi:hypothetical protein
MCGSLGIHDAGEDGFDLATGHTRILFAELDADPCRASSLCAAWCDPYDVPGHRDLLLAVHECEQHEYLIAQFVGPTAWYEDSAALNVRHVRRIQGVLVLDRERQDAGTRASPRGARAWHWLQGRTRWEVARNIGHLVNNVLVFSLDDVWDDALPADQQILNQQQLIERSAQQVSHLGSCVKKTV